MAVRQGVTVYLFSKCHASGWEDGVAVYHF